ncbi:MAG: outer membrane protein assembly factor BamD [Planctomycetes bacterium]|nr:outer membrane protein assembly factor BamD [Planctomycetota bacterium]
MTQQSQRGSSLLQAFFLVTLATLACFAPAHSAEDSGAAKPAAAPTEPGVPDGVRAALLAHEWDRALGALDKAKVDQPQFTDWWTYLRGTVLARAKQNDAAFAAFDAVERASPPSEWRHKARFARADLLRELGRAKDAEAIYEAEARRLLSESRQEELAKIYLDAADALSTPPAKPTPNAPPLDWNRAAVLYRKALELDVGAAIRERALYRVMVCLQSSANAAQAVQVSNEYRDAFDPTKAKSNPVGEHLFEVLYRRAECQRSLGLNDLARRDLEDLIAAIDGVRAKREPWGDWLAGQTQALQSELARIDGDAHRAIGDTYGDDANSVRLAVAAIERFLAKFPSHPKHAEAEQSIGLRYARAGLDEDALKAFDAFLRRAEPTDPVAREGFARLHANALFNKGEVLTRQKRFELAIAAFAEYVARFSTGAEWSRAQAGILAAEFARGDALRDDRKYAEARNVWTSCLERYPLDPRAAPTSFAIGATFAAEARSLTAGDPKRNELFRSAIEQWRRVVAKYPNTDPASQSLYSIGELEERELGELERAVEDYQACSFGTSAGDARTALVRMTEPALTITSEKAWRTATAPRVKVDVRNLEKLKVDVFALDLEAYFRKQLSHVAVEDLDLDLIAPDRTVERSVEGYAKYQPIAFELELPVKGPGVWAIAVTAGELRATTLVVSSDIDVIVRSAAKELLVFAEDMVREKPAKAVRVLVAGVNKDGVPTVREAITGEDGTVRVDVSEFEGASASVLALREGHYAAAGGATRNPSTSTPRMPRGVVYTDRPAYRPGELVHWRAILREVQDGRFGFTAGKAYDVIVSDAQGRVVSKKKVTLSEFGTLASDVVLDEFAIVGDWRIACSTPNGPSFFGAFQVQQYQLPKVELELSTPREIYFRGERVDVTARAKFYWGEPVANAKLAAMLPDGRVLELSTDAQGKAEFGFETRDFAAETSLSYSATLSEEGLTTQDSVFVAVHEFRAYVGVKNDVYLAGSSFDVTVGTPGVDGKPVSRPMKLVAVKHEFVDGCTTETQVGEWSLTTDAVNGEAHQAITLARGGAYVLRASGVDRFGNPVVGERSVEISGDEDAQRLRWLVDTHVFEVGAKATLTLVDREADGLALLTIESDTFLEHRILALKKGTNSVELALDHAHFPSFTAAVAMMRPGALFTDEVQLSVRRALRVEVEPESPDCKPGEDASFRIATFDQLGRPVSAELSLALVDEAVFGLWGDTLPDVRALFDAAEERRGNFSTSSSATFRYHGETRTIAAAVLAEQARAKEEGAWDANQAELLRGLGYEGEASADAFVGGAARLALGRPRAGAPGAPPPSDAAEKTIGSGGHYGTGVPSVYAARQAGGRGKGRGGQATGKVYRGPGDTVPANVAALETFDTAYWSPSVVTDANGKATVKAKIPERSTRWRVVAVGADKGQLFGQTRASLVSKEEFFVELRAPLWLTEGDAPRCTARVHNLTGLRGTAKLVLRATRGNDVKVYPLDVTLGDANETEVVFPALEPLAGGGDLQLDLEATGELDGSAAAGTRAESVSARPYRPVAKSSVRSGVRPWGVDLAAAKSGVLEGSASIELQLDPKRKTSGRSLEIALGPNVDALLVNAALGNDGFLLRAPGDGHATNAADLLGACETLALVEASGRAENPEHARLFERAQGLVARLVAAQRTDGHWSWIGTEQEPHVETSSLALVALARARARGVPVFDAALTNGRAALLKSFREAPQQADELKAMLSWALAENEQGDFGALNRLHRERATLSPAALAYTALALAAMNRGPMAAEVADVLETKSFVQEGPKRCAFATEGNIAWSRSRLAMNALAAVALERAKPTSAKLPAVIEELLATRPWYDGRARGLAIAAIAMWRGKTQPSNERMRVKISCAGLEAATVDFSTERPGETLSWDVPDELPAKLSIAFELEGRGRPHFSAVLRGFTGDLDQKRSEELSLRYHDYLAAAPRHRGREIPTGFGAIDGQHQQWKNEVAELGYGGMLRAALDFNARGDWSSKRDTAHYLVLELPLPAGARLLEGSLSANVLHHEERDGVLFLHLGQCVNWVRLDYTLVGVVPGKYRVAPPVLRSLYEPERMSIGEAKALTVLAKGETSKDSYRATPDELFHFGKALYDDGDLEGARVRLQQLFDEWEAKLSEQTRTQAAGWLLFANIERKASRDIVRYFEILKEKNPDLYVPFDKVMAVGAAYREIEEHERALTIFRATIEETFGKELRVVGTLEEQNEPYDAIQTMQRLCREYPDAASVVVASLSLSDKLLKLAPVASRDPELVAKGIDRGMLTVRGVLELQRFLAAYVLDPLAPEAGLNLVTAHLAIDDYKTAAKLGGEFAVAFGEPRFSDAFAYARAVAEWYLGRDDESLKALERIANAEYAAADGTKSPSPNRDLALYILGQIHHARQEFGKAAGYYERVQELFADAREAVAGFRERMISVEELTTARPGARVEVEIEHRNVKEAELLVYPVDLMTLYLRERNLSRVTQVNLSGIAPKLQRKVELASTDAMRPTKTKVTLDLKEPGAYLVMCRGGDLHASGLVLLTQLELEVREEPATGHMRVQVSDQKTHAYVRGVDVRVIGARNRDFLSGRTDPRGLFVTEGIVGNATVIARTDERHYAFHRGTVAHAFEQAGKRIAPPGQTGNEDYFQNVTGLNRAVQDQREQNFVEEVRKDRQGVQIRTVR